MPSSKKCNEEGCTKQSRWKSTKCTSHGGWLKCSTEDCIKRALDKTGKCRIHGGRLCDEYECKKIAIGKNKKCTAHGGGRRCITEGCGKSAAGKTNKCIYHGGGRRCSYNECLKAARSNSKTCVEHGGGRRCIETDCNKSAQGKTDKCKRHGGGKRCIEPGCNTTSYGTDDKCINHGGGRRCIEPLCRRGSQGITKKCKAHGGGDRCPNCITWIDSRSGQSSHDGYCVTCFKQIFPNDPRSKIIYKHSKELRVRNIINDNFEGFIHDRPLYTGNCDCSHRRRVDHRKLIGNTLLCIETDEFAHKDYDKKDEEIRYNDLYMIHSGKWIFIRFNPDGAGIDIIDKLEHLITQIQLQIDRIENEENTELVEIIKMFY